MPRTIEFKPIAGQPNGVRYHFDVLPSRFGDVPEHQGIRHTPSTEKGNFIHDKDEILTLEGGIKRAVGTVWGLSDKWEFSGKLLDFQVGNPEGSRSGAGYDPGPARVIIDGKPATGAMNPYDISIRPSNAVANLNGAKYRFVCTERVTADSNIEPHDFVGYNGANGEVYSAPDNYTGKGGMLIKKMPDNADLYINGQKIQHKLVVRGQGGPKEHYRFATSGPCVAKLAQREKDDWIATAGARGLGATWGEEGTGGYVSGFIGGNYHDVFFFNGDVQYFQSTFNADYNVIRNFRRWV